MQESPLVDEYTYAILNALATPSTAAEIAAETSVPIATVHRRLSALAESSLVHSWREHRHGSGGDPLVYQRTRDEVTIAFEPPSIEERVERAARLNK